MNVKSQSSQNEMNANGSSDLQNGKNGQSSTDKED